MYKILAYAALIFLLIPADYSQGFATRGEDCTKCHTLNKGDAAALIKEALPDTKVLSIRVSPSKAMWELLVEMKDKKGIVYIDFPKKHIFSGTLLDIKSRKNLTQESYNQLNIIKVDASKIPLKDALELGNKNAKKRIIVFTDPDCPFCAKLHSEIKKVVTERNDVLFLIKMYPLPIHKDAAEKAKAIVCEKSLALLENAFDKKPLPKPACTSTAVDDNVKLAKKLGIGGTPAMVMPDGTVVSGFKEAKDIKELIDRK